MTGRSKDQGVSSVKRKDYDAGLLIEKREDRRITLVIPSKKNHICPRKTCSSIYKKRSISERFFARLTRFRGTATCYDKLKSPFITATNLVSAVIGVN